MIRLFFVVAFLLTLSLPAVGHAEDAQKPARLNATITVQMDYLIYLPKDYEKQKSWPLLLFLHGGGERGTDLNAVKMHGPPMLVAQGKDFPFIIVSPLSPEARIWEPMVLLALLDEIEKKYKVDTDREYVTGLSMGGVGSWSLAANAPHRFAAIAPICGNGETSWTERLAHLPVWAFHGAKDKGSPVEKTQAMYDAHKKAGGNSKLTIYPEAGHDAWTETYNNPEFYEWLLAQKRTPTK